MLRVRKRRQFFGGFAHVFVLVSLALLGCEGASAAGDSIKPAVTGTARPPLTRAVRTKVDATFGERLEMDGETKVANATNPAVFFAFPTSPWWSGLVPLFEVELRESLELRRRPAKGMENGRMRR